MERLEVAEHEHPLKLIDLQVQYQEEEEEEDDEEEAGDPITKEVFYGAKCERCGEEIHMYHMYYYNCMECDFSLHKFCGELSNRLDHPLHPHPLIFQHQINYGWECKICKSYRNYGEHDKYGKHGYGCDKCFHFKIDVKCAVEGGKNIINHPCHPHLLICPISKPILCHCCACGKRHEGVFYICATCSNFTIHSECAFLPKTLLIQESTHDAFHHTHPLTISYSFPIPDQEAKHDPKCRVCGEGFYRTSQLWIYKCDKCIYYAHMDCATSRRKYSFKPAVLVKNYKDADHPRLLHLPFPDETHSIPKHLFFQKSESDYEVNLTHMSHPNPLILVDHTQNKTSTSSSEMIDSWLSKCHDPMKKTQLLCNGCLRPITSTMPFYTCAHQITCCNFALHEWCTRLPPKIENHPGHPQHTLHLIYPNQARKNFNVFVCQVCHLPCNGFAYGCGKCKDYYADVTCAFLPREITHEAHPNHLFSLLVQFQDLESCHMCLEYVFRGQLSFKCNSCSITIHLECALLLPKVIRHRYDKKHSMHLSYLPIENHKSQYFCEICEEDLNPHQSFYHCQPCAQSVHAACAPLILESETETLTSYHSKNIYHFVNITFGGVHNIDVHTHSLSFSQGTVLDGKCSKCDEGLRYEMIFKCLKKCGFAIHHKCCKLLNKI